MPGPLLPRLKALSNRLEFSDSKITAADKVLVATIIATLTMLEKQHSRLIEAEVRYQVAYSKGIASKHPTDIVVQPSQLNAYLPAALTIALEKPQSYQRATQVLLCASILDLSELAGNYVQKRYRTQQGVKEADREAYLQAMDTINALVTLARNQSIVKHRASPKSPALQSRTASPLPLIVDRAASRPGTTRAPAIARPQSPALSNRSSRQPGNARLFYLTAPVAAVISVRALQTGAGTGLAFIYPVAKRQSTLPPNGSALKNS